MGCNRSRPPEEEKAPPATAKWEGPVQGALEEWTELLGTTTPSNDRVARVTAPVEGRVLSILSDSSHPTVVEGQRVEKGTPLVQLDPTLITAALAKAEAAQEVLKQEEHQAGFAVELASSEVDRLKALKAEEDKTPGTRTLVSPVDRLKADFALKDCAVQIEGSERQAGGWDERAGVAFAQP